MDSEALATELNYLLATELCGLARHLENAQPYLTASTYSVWTDVQRMLAANTHCARRLSELLDRLELPERPMTHPSSVAAFHYTDLAYLLPLLLDEKRRQVSSYQRAIGYVDCGPQNEDIVTALTDMLHDHQSQLGQLEDHHRTISADTAIAERK